MTCPGVSLTLCCFVVYSTRRFVLSLTLCYFVLVFVSPFSIAITSLWEERANLWFCLFPLPLVVWEWLRLMIVELPGLFSHLFCQKVSEGIRVPKKYHRNREFPRHQKNYFYYFHNCESYPLPNNVKQTNMFVVLFMFPLFLCLLLVLHGEKYLHLYTIHAHQSYEKKDISVCCRLFRCLTDCIT